MRRATVVILGGLCCLLAVNAGATGTAGSLTPASPTFDRPNEGAPPSSLSGDIVPYQMFTVTHTIDGGYLVVVMRGADGGGGTVADPYLVLYTAGGFNPASPLANALWTNDNMGAGNDATLAVLLPAGTYTVVATGHSPATALGTFQLIWVSTDAAAATVLPGEITGADPTFVHSVEGIHCASSGQSAHYDVYTVNHTGGLFGVTVGGHSSLASLTLNDGFLEIHNGGTFTPASPCVGFVDADDNSSYGGDPGFVGILPAGQYDIVVSGANSEELGTYGVSYMSMDPGLANVPALRPWGLGILALLLAVAGALAIRSRMF